MSLRFSVRLETRYAMARFFFSFAFTLMTLAFAGCASVKQGSRSHQTDSTTQPSALEPPDPERPAPVLPQEALFLGKHANLDLNITAARDGSITKVAISKPSHVRVYDEYIRNWVQEHWKMPEAKTREADLRTIIAPIVFPESGMGDPKRYPSPPYPSGSMADHEEGFVFLLLKVNSAGSVESAKVLKGTGHPRLDNHTVRWVCSKWSFPEGQGGQYYLPIVYLLGYR